MRDDRKKLPLTVRPVFLRYTKEALKTVPKIKCPICDGETQTTFRGVYECLFCGTIINLSRPAIDILHIKTGKKDRTYTQQSIGEEKLIVKEFLLKHGRVIKKRKKE